MVGGGGGGRRRGEWMEGAREGEEIGDIAAL